MAISDIPNPRYTRATEMTGTVTFVSYPGAVGAFPDYTPAHLIDPQEQQDEPRSQPFSQRNAQPQQQLHHHQRSPTTQTSPQQPQQQQQPGTTTTTTQPTPTQHTHHQLEPASHHRAAFLGTFLTVLGVFYLLFGIMFAAERHQRATRRRLETGPGWAPSWLPFGFADRPRKRSVAWWVCQVVVVLLWPVGFLYSLLWFAVCAVWGVGWRWCCFHTGESGDAVLGREVRKGLGDRRFWPRDEWCERLIGWGEKGDEERATEERIDNWCRAAEAARREVELDAEAVVAREREVRRRADVADAAWVREWGGRASWPQQQPHLQAECGEWSGAGEVEEEIELQELALVHSAGKGAWHADSSVTSLGHPRRPRRVIVLPEATSGGDWANGYLVRELSTVQESVGRSTRRGRGGSSRRPGRRY